MTLFKKLTAVLCLAGLFFSAAAADDSLRRDINAALSEFFTDTEATRVSETPITGLYQVLIGPDVIYMTRDGRYVVKGDLLDMDVRRNLTEEARSDVRAELINAIPEDEYIEFGEANARDAIYVFTDVDCGYCQKLHRDVPELNANGVSVRYLAYPRAGILSATGREMSNVWCADDKQQALTASKNRQSVTAKECDDPVARQYALGKQLGVRGTPAIYLQNGKMLPGYMPPAEIIGRLDR